MWLDRLFRVFLILAAAVVGGLLLYALTPDLTPRFGEDIAAVWSWLLIILSGLTAHRVLPKKDLSGVSHVLLAILASSVAAITGAWILLVVLDLTLEHGVFSLLLLVGLAALAFATVVFCPVYWMRAKLGPYQAVVYVILGGVMPAAWVFVARPFGNDDIKWISYEAAYFAVIGVAAAIGFMLVANRAKKSGPRGDVGR